MKEQLRRALWFILRGFETGDAPYTCKPLNRIILAVVGCLFFLLCAVTVWLSAGGGSLGYLIPVAVFFSVGFVCMTVAGLGSDRAVAKIWGNR